MGKWKGACAANEAFWSGAEQALAQSEGVTERAGAEASDPAAGEHTSSELFSVSYATPEALGEAHERELARGALFVPTLETRAPGVSVRVVLDFEFCEGQVELEGEVVASMPADMARTGARPGLSLQIREPVSELRGRIEALTGLALPEVDQLPPDSKRRSPRFPTRAGVVLEASGRSFSAEAVDISYNGALVLLPGVDIGESSEVHVRLEHPRAGSELRLQGRVANQTRCDHGVMAVGVQFLYAVDRIEEVTHFVDEMRAVHQARKLATVSGSLCGTSLEAVLETFSSVSSAGTLLLTCGGQQGKVAYRDGEILYTTTGLVSGAKALGRMFTWTDADFEFRREVEPIDDAPAPLPLQSAIISGAVERDEIAHLDLAGLGPDSVFALDEQRLAALVAELDDLAVDIAENAGMGFPLAALIDIVTAGDAVIYKTLVDLVQAGILSSVDG